MKMKKSLPFATAFIVPLIAGLAVFSRGAWLLVPPFFLFVLTPALDLFLAPTTADPEPNDRPRDARYDVWLWAWVPLQLAIQVAALVIGARASSPGELVGVMFATGLLGAIGINVAHELMHRRGAPERALAEVIMTSVAYTHFCVEHVLGHHKNVATPNDPASARPGESILHFLPRSIALSLVSAWHLEGLRVRRVGARALADRRVRYPLVLALVVAGVVAALGPMGLLVFAGQSLVAVLLLETINYVEHYGLQRTESAPGVFERVDPAHSWTSAHAMTSWYLFNLPRHADHHAQASRPYYALRHLPQSPQLPAGYATMLVVAWAPPLWRAIMDKRVDALRTSAAASMR